MALSKGNWTCMMTTSGESSRASFRASASLGTSATTSMPPKEARILARPCLNRVWSSASSTLIGPFVFRFPPNTPRPVPLVPPEGHCTV